MSYILKELCHSMKAYESELIIKRYFEMVGRNLLDLTILQLMLKGKKLFLHPNKRRGSSGG